MVGATSFENLRTFEDQIHPTFKEACRASETTLGEDTKDPTTHWGSERR